MYRLTPGASHRFTAAVMLAALAACAEPTHPVRATSAKPIIIIGGHPIVFAAQLRAIGNPNEIGNPDEKPLNAVVGHLLLKVAETEGGGLVVTWKAHFANPECSGATAFGGGDVYIQDSEDTPNPLADAVLRLLAPGTLLGCGDNFLEGSSPVTESFATALVEDQDSLVAAFFLEDGAIIAGTLQLAGDEIVITR